MHRTSEYLKRVCKKCFHIKNGFYVKNDSHVKNGFHLNKRYLHARSNNKWSEKQKTVRDCNTKTYARTRVKRKKDKKKIHLKERVKLVVFSSLYFIFIDYLYHKYVLKDTPDWKTTENEKNKNNNTNIKTDKTNSVSYSVDPQKKIHALMQYFKKDGSESANISSSNESDNHRIKNRNILNESNKPFRDFFSKGEQSKSDESVNNKKTVEEEEEEDTIKVNRIHNQQSNNSIFYVTDSLDRLSREWWNNKFFLKNDKKEENDKKGILKKDIYDSINDNKQGKYKNSNDTSLVRDVYRQFVFNGCNLFLFINGVVFLGWRLSELVRNKRFHNFMSRNFICSYENLKKKYYHTCLTASISHITFPHFLFNMYAFYVISNALVSPEIKESAKKYFFFNFKSNTVEKKITDIDIINVCILSSLCSTIPYVLLNKNNRVLGASGSLMGLIYILSTVKPNEVFVSLFPFPYLKLTALQLCHITILTNFLFLFVKRNVFNVAWTAHLFGFLGGAIYNIYQRNKNNYNYYPFWELSLTNGKIDYRNSYDDFLVFLNCFQLKMQLLFTLDPNKERAINKKINSIKFMQMQRKIKINNQKKKNMDSITRRLISEE